MRFALAVAAPLVLAAPAAAAQPQYGAFPAEPAFTGRAASPVLDTADAKMYRTRLREGVLQAPNFDGHYSFVTWGCGMGCETGAVVDQITGRVTFTPFSMCCAEAYDADPNFDYIKFRRDSRLVAFTGKRDEKGLAGEFLYTFEDGEFRAVDPVKARAPAPPPSGFSACRAIPSDAERLACYDKQAGR